VNRVNTRREFFYATPQDKFPKEEVARLGYDGLMAGDDMVVGGGDDERQVIERNRITPEPIQAAAHARLVRPDR
jgi:uncharacterized protein